MAEAPRIPKRTDTLYVLFTAEINPNTIERLMALMAQAAQKSVNTVYLALSTPGGNVQAGFTLYNALQSMPFNLITHNIGSVNSMGNVVFLSGDTRYATANATFMFHGVGFDISGPARFEEKDIRDRLETILSDQKRMGQIIASRTDIVNDRIAELFRAQKTVDSAWAKDNGIVNEIRDFDIPPGSPIVSFVFQR